MKKIYNLSDFRRKLWFKIIKGSKMGQKLLKGQKYVKKWSKMGQISPEIFHR